MKKIFQVSLLICLLFVSGCGKNNKQDKEKKIDTSKEPVEEVEVIEEDQYVDDNPIIVGLYDTNDTLVTEYYTTKTNFKDLVFGVVYTNDEHLINGYTKYIWNYYYNNYTDIDNYKIGYNISFYNDNNELITKNITYVEDEYIVNPYFYVYLYDDINQVDGAWYSHLTKDDVKDNTIFTSIKLYLVQSEHISSPITLTAFTYDSDDDFDEDGNYRGNSKYTITINWQ